MSGFFQSKDFRRLAKDIKASRPRRVGFFNSKEFKDLAKEIMRSREEARKYR